MKFPKQTVKSLPLDGQTVLVRADYNVPRTADGDISDDLRIKASIPTITYLLRQGCRVVLISHLGRPNGREKKYSLEPVVARLSELLDQEVAFVDDCIGDTVYQAVKRAPSRSVTLLENLRFYSEEEANDEVFAKKLAHDSRASFFVMDGFSVAHRAHASTQAITLFLPSVAGFSVEKEYLTITAALETPKRPLVAIMGGAKVSDKIGVIETFVSIADKIIIGGAMANTFLAYRGFSVGKSLCEPDQFSTLDKIYAAAHEKVGENVDDFIVLPEDVAVASRISPEAKRVERSSSDIRSGDIALDIGDKAIETITPIIEQAKTVVWNGTMGYAEFPNFAHGSARVALAIASNTKATSIIGGGDTADFVLKWDGHDGQSFSYVSIGGGATLDLMAGKSLPGIESLLDAR